MFTSILAFYYDRMSLHNVTNMKCNNSVDMHILFHTFWYVNNFDSLFSPSALVTQNKTLYEHSQLITRKSWHTINYQMRKLSSANLHFHLLNRLSLEFAFHSSFEDIATGVVSGLKQRSCNY